MKGLGGPTCSSILHAPRSQVASCPPPPSKSHGTTSGPTALTYFPRKTMSLQAPATAPLICPCPPPHPAAGGHWCHLGSVCKACPSPTRLCRDGTRTRWCPVPASDTRPPKSDSSLGASCGGSSPCRAVSFPVGPHWSCLGQQAGLLSSVSVTQDRVRCARHT